MTPQRIKQSATALRVHPPVLLLLRGRSGLANAPEKRIRQGAAAISSAAAVTVADAAQSSVRFSPTRKHQRQPIWNRPMMNFTCPLLGRSRRHNTRSKTVLNTLQRASPTIFSGRWNKLAKRLAATAKAAVAAVVLMVTSGRSADAPAKKGRQERKDEPTLRASEGNAKGKAAGGGR